MLLDSLIPVFLVIAAGWGARASGLIPDPHWNGLERIAYQLFFPAVIVQTLATADLASVPVVGVGASLVGGVLALTALLYAIRPLLARSAGLDGPGFTSLVQGCTRWNTFVALAVAGGLFGARGLALMAVAIAALVPLLNVIAVMTLARYARGRIMGWRDFASTLATNPFVWSCALGLLLNPVSADLPRAAIGAVDILGKASLGAGLLAVGAGLDLRGLARPRLVHGLALALKLVALPVIATGLARAFGVSGVDLAVTVLASAVPTAGASYLLAKQMGGDAPLMAEIITLQTLAALVTMPLMLSWLAS